MKQNSWHIAWVGMLVLVLTGAAPATYAQQTYTLKIQDGTVYVNNEVIAADALPASLDVRGITAHFTFSGDSTPFIQLNGHVYALDGKQLRDVSDSEREGVTVFFRDRSGGEVPFLTRSLRTEPGVMFFSLDDQGSHLAFVKEHMNEQARELQAISRKLAQQSGAGREALVAQLQRQAEESVFVAEELPRMEVQGYLSEVQRQDQTLYLQLLDEQRMDFETRELAATIMQLPQGAKRTTLVEELRTKLNTIFEIKQNNRRLEIEQFEKRLEDLYKRLNEREQMRDRIVDRRLQELIRN